MARITLEQIKNQVQEAQWTVVSDNYQNLNTEMHFKCDQGHDVYAPWKNLRQNLICPICQKLQQPFVNIEVKPKARGVTRILALDQASHITGYAIFDDTELISSGIFTAKSASEIERIASIKYWVMQMIENWKPDVLGLEGIQFQEVGTEGQHMGVTVFETLAHLQGVLMLMAHEAKIKCEVCPTNTWRHACGVKGRSRTDKKRSMQQLVKQWYSVNVTDDVADAIGIGYYLSHKIVKFNSIINWE